MTNFTATYSVEDNAIRLTADGRVGTETYERLKAARFQWQRGSNTFKAAAWSPEQEDLALELAGEIEDEDSTLEERAEARADRYEELSEARSRDASSAYQASKSISDGIPMGQPILVGHHSEGRHRSDLRKIDNRMRKACENWKKAEHWEARATAALRHAKYKNDPSVRARRIKGLEADQRKVKKNIVESQETIDAWNILSSMKDREQAKDLACRLGGGWFKFPLSEYPRPEGSPAFLMSEDSIQMCTALERGLVDFEKAHELVVGLHQGYAERARRWADHYEMRLVYERAMLKASGGTMADRTKPEKGGAVQCWVSPRGGWSLIAKVNKVSVTVMQKANYGGKFYAVNMPLDKLSAVMTAAEVSAARESGTLREATEDQHSFFIVSAGPEALAGQAAE
jgi:hypothetical protein